MFPFDMVPLLCCPSCMGPELRPELTKQTADLLEAGALVCSTCGESYPIQAGIPNLLPQAELSTPEWSAWSQHLRGLQNRRQQERRYGRFLHSSRWKSEQAFIEFAGMTEGNLLDVGCANGNLRAGLDEKHLTYFGLDPILPEPETPDFRYVHGLGEYLPFRDSTFSSLVVKAALDHFCDINRFFREAVRVLEPGGRVHLLQSVHEVTGPLAAVKMIAHRIKDAIDHPLTRLENGRTPKHMAEFEKPVLLEVLRSHFEVISVREYSSSWYSPRQLFVSLAPLE